MNKKLSSSDNTYKVGHGHPPLETRFKKGRSGNPSGRKKGSKSFKTVVAEVANELVVLKGASGKTKHIPRLHGILVQTGNNAIRGDTRSARLFLELVEKFGLDQADQHDGAPLSDEDQAILARFRKRGMPGEDPGTA